MDEVRLWASDLTTVWARDGRQPDGALPVVGTWDCSGGRYCTGVPKGCGSGSPSWSVRGTDMPVGDGEGWGYACTWTTVGGRTIGVPTLFSGPELGEPYRTPGSSFWLK